MPPAIAPTVTVWIMSDVTILSAHTVAASTEESGVASCQISLVAICVDMVVAIRPVGLITVPTAKCPALLADSEALALELGETEADGELEIDELGDNEAEGLREADGDWLKLAEADGDNELDGDSELDGLNEPLGLMLVEEEGLIEVEADGLKDPEGETLALGLDERDELGESEPDGDIEVEAEGDTEAWLSVETILAKMRTEAAPTTVNKVVVPTAPVLVSPVKVILFWAARGQLALVTVVGLGIFISYFCLFFMSL